MRGRLLIYRKPAVLGGGAVFALLMLVAVWRLPQLRATDTPDVPRVLDFASVKTQVVQLRENVFVLVGVGDDVFGGNIVAQIGTDGVLLVDTQYHQLGEQNLAAIRSLTDEPVRYIINTHMHVDHVGGNEILSANRAPSAEGEARAPILAQENVLRRLSRPRPAGRRREIWPTQTYKDSMDFEFNGELVSVRHEPRAHTDGDSFVHFTGSGVVAAGDIFNNMTYPVIDRDNGGSVQGVIAALDDLIEMLVEPDAKIVPGHGSVADKADVLEYRDMVVSIRDSIDDMIDEGMSLEQVQASRPTADFDARFGRELDFWGPRRFVETVYRELAGEP